MSATPSLTLEDRDVAQRAAETINAFYAKKGVDAGAHVRKDGSIATIFSKAETPLTRSEILRRAPPIEKSSPAGAVLLFMADMSAPATSRVAIGVLSAYEPRLISNAIVRLCYSGHIKRFPGRRVRYVLTYVGRAEVARLKAGAP
ncbi:MAG: hypothetical protein AAGB02_03070 [Pseudomonadota bacterium]